MSDEAMRCLSLWQPWASSIARGWKRVETRGRRTHHRGPIAIHAAKVWGPGQLAASLRLAELLEAEPGAFVPGPGRDFPFGAVVAVAELVDCVEMTPEVIAATHPLEQAFGDWRPGRFAYHLEDVKRLRDPYKLKGRQSLWTLTSEQTQEIRSRL